MKDYLVVGLALYLIFVAVLAFVKPERYTQKLKGKFTPESLATYSKVTGAGVFVAALGYLYGGLNKLGVLKFGPNFSEKKVALTVYVALLAFFILLFVIARVAILKPIKGASEEKKSNLADEDF